MSPPSVTQQSVAQHLAVLGSGSPLYLARAAAQYAAEQEDAADRIGRERDALVYRMVDAHGERYGWNLATAKACGMSQGLWYRIQGRRGITNYATPAQISEALADVGRHKVKRELPSVTTLESGEECIARIRDLHAQVKHHEAAKRAAVLVRDEALGALCVTQPSNVEIADLVGVEEQTVYRARVKARTAA